MHQEAIFYLFPEPSIAECLRDVCHLVEKCYLDGKKVFIQSAIPNVLQQLDDLLWTFHDTSFLPHSLFQANEAIAENFSILLGSGENIPLNQEVLINLCSSTLSCYKQFQQILEIVPDDENIKAAARERYKLYQTEGFKLANQKVTRTLR
ncbi:MAG: DNA polymerase III subunit chi [Gammaproteobacteria bacterium]|jgi:DNA polymerase-3 subunit chi